MARLTNGRLLKKYLFRFYEADIEELRKMASKEGNLNTLVREIVHIYVRQAGARTRARIDALSGAERAEREDKLDA